MNFRNRVKEFRLLRADDVAPNPRNWRAHPPAQHAALRSLLSEVGIAGAVIAYQSGRTGKLTLIDGHERMTFGEPFPALILDVTDDEADKLLAAFDPIGAMAEANADALAALLRDVVYQEPDLQNLVTAVSLTAQALPDERAISPDDLEAVWSGMPDFEQPEAPAWKTIKVHFENENDYAEFARVIGQELSERTRYIWYPKQKHAVRSRHRSGQAK